MQKVGPIIFLIVLLCCSATAQDAHHLGFSPAVSFVRVSGSNNLKHNSLGQGLFARGTITWDMHKSWLEGGGGIEVGKMSGRVETRDTFTTIYGDVETRWDETWEEFVSPFANLYMMSNAKWILGEGKYMYGGGVVGMIVARSGLLYRATVVNWYAGLSGGIVFPIDDITGLDIGIGWRRTKLNGDGSAKKGLKPELREYVIESIVLKQVTFSLGIVVHFE